MEEFELVQVRKNQVVCTSLQIAERFDKEHARVLRDIRELQCSDKFRVGNFAESYYKNAQGKKQPMYYITKNGFAFLVMGYTGKKAARFKEAFIDAFDKAIETLKQLQSQEHLEAREQGKIARRAETDAIKLFVEYAESQGSKHTSNYYMLFSKLANSVCGVTDRNLATPEQLINLAVCENIIRNSVMAGMVEGKYYKDIYQDAKARLADFAAIAYIGQSFLLVKGA